MRHSTAAKQRMQQPRGLAGRGQNDWLRDAEAKPKIAVDTEMLM